MNTIPRGGAVITGEGCTGAGQLAEQAHHPFPKTVLTSNQVLSPLVAPSHPHKQTQRTINIQSFFINSKSQG